MPEDATPTTEERKQEQEKELADKHPEGQHPAAEKRIEEIAERLDIDLPKTKLPLPVKIIGLLMVLGGLSVAGTLLTDVILGSGAIVFSFIRLGVGVLVAIIGYGLIRRRLLAVIGFGVGCVIAGIFTHASLIVTVPMFLYLLTERRYFRPGFLGKMFKMEKKMG